MRQEQHVQAILDEEVSATNRIDGYAVEGEGGGREHEHKVIGQDNTTAGVLDKTFIDKEVLSSPNPCLVASRNGADPEKQDGGAVEECQTQTSKPASINHSRRGSTDLTQQVSVDAHGNVYPEGGLRAWLVVYGAWSGMTASFGLMNSIGTFQAYLSTNQLSKSDPSTIGWIFSIYSFLSFFCGIQIGPIFDAKGPRALVLAGTVCMVGGTLGIAEGTKLWHFVLSFSVAGGLGTALVFTPAVSSIAHFFFAKRAAATGLATTGGSIGGIIFPLMLQRLFPTLGFRWAVRILAFIFLFQLVIANLLIRSRLPAPAKGSPAASILPDWKVYKNVTFCFTTAGTFFMEWALFIPLSYLTSYALSQGVNANFSYQLLAVLNAGSFFGRWAPGFLADRVGRFNTMIVTVGICMLSVLCLWLTAATSANLVPQLIVFALIFGFGSGSNISLVPVCVGQLCRTEVFGRWYAALYTIVSFGCLTGIPLAGSILNEGKGDYSGLIIFVGVCYAAGLACFIAARVGEVGWGLKARY